MSRLYEENIRLEEDRARRNEMKEQDNAYLKSLKIDKAKAEEKKKKEREEKEKALQEQIKVQQEQIKVQQEQRAKEEKEALLKQKLSTLPPEPPTSDPNIVNLTFQLPTGERISRFFLKDNTFQEVKDFLDTRDLSGSSIPASYNIISDFPKTIWDNLSLKLSETPFQRRQLLRLEQISS